MVALAHGTSDGQKTMGVITLVLITAGYQDSGTGPQTWVIASAGLAIGLGTYSGGWRIMRTMGKGIVASRLLCSQAMPYEQEVVELLEGSPA